jgi:hypothetical protein
LRIATEPTSHGLDANHSRHDIGTIADDSSVFSVIGIGIDTSDGAKIGGHENDERRLPAVQVREKGG